jgi:hypothetical protein
MPATRSQVKKNDGGVTFFSLPGGSGSARSDETKGASAYSAATSWAAPRSALSLKLMACR